jgi:D-lactate dehydrogenase (cytochrome)
MIIKTEQDQIQSYLRDESNFIGTCNAVYIPESENEVIELVKECNVKKIRITIAGNGTGLTSGRVPQGGIVLSLEKMNNIIELNENGKYVIVQPGVLLADLQQLVEEKKLFYPPDPTERNCHVGATAINNSSGARTFKYGPTRDYILGINLVLPNGEFIKVKRGDIFAKDYKLSFKTESGKNISFDIPKFEMPNTKNSAGYFCKEDVDLIDLFIGSEGTLGIITELKIKLIDLPKDLLSSVIFFADEDSALDFISEARDIAKNRTSENQLDPRGLENFDNYSLRFLQEDFPNIPKNAKSAVWFEQELGDNEDELISVWMELIGKYNGMEEESWLAFDKKEQEELKNFRHAIAVKVNEFITKRGLKKIGTDVAVPDDVFKEYYHKVKKMIEARGLKFVVYGHVGNSHIHLNFLPENQEEYVLARGIYEQICLEAIKLKGTFSAEHGVGKTKRDYLIKMYGEDVVKQMASLKLSLDPNKLMNIGNIFDEKFLG